MGMTSIVRAFSRRVFAGAQFARTTIDPGAGANQDAVHFSDPGDDAQPLPGDLVASASNAASNGQNALGYVDQQNAGITAAGEKRIYARDADGVISASIFLHNDGSIILANENATLTISATGDFDWSGGSFTINGQQFATHIHSAGTLMDSTPAPVTGNTGAVV